MRGAARKALGQAGLGRSYSVLAWGRNTEGQCGVTSFLPLLLQAREVEALAGLPVAALTAGKTHSAGVLGSGEVLTWGEGRDGKLGHGSTDNVYVPHCVESLAGRVHVVAAALGRQHTLFLDSSGWSPGLTGSLSAAAGGGGSGGGAAAAAAQRHQAGGVAAAAAQQTFEQQQFERSVEWFSQNAWQTTNLKPFLEHRQRAVELETALSMYDADMRVLVSRQSAWQCFEAAKGSDIAIPGLMPGQIAIPVRLGRANQGIFSPMVAELAGLDSEHIVQLSAGRFMSVAVTARGEVWTFGGSFNGDLGSGGGASLSLGPRRVGGILAQVLADNGGTLKVAAGSAFCVALTTSGRVVLWGAPHGSEALAAQPAVAAAAAAAAAAQSLHGRRRRRPSAWPVTAPAPLPAAAVAAHQAAAAAAGGPVEQESIPSLRILKQPGMLVAEIVDLPPMTDVAAGFTHITMTDGSSVWTIGRQAPAAGAGTADLQWLRPRRVMHQPDDGIASMAAGSFSTAAITGAGELFLWGTLLTEDASAALVKQSEDEGLGHWAHSSTADPAAMQWTGWEGMGGPEPRRVPGLHQVQQISLGTHHALAVVA